MHDHPTLGDASFVVAVSGGIWLRRFGPGYAPGGHPGDSSFHRAAHHARAVHLRTRGSWPSDLDSRHRPGGDGLGERRAVGRRAPHRQPAESRTRRPRSPQRDQQASFLPARGWLPRWRFPPSPQRSPSGAWLYPGSLVVDGGHRLHRGKRINRGSGCDVAYKSILRIAGAAGGTIVATLVCRGNTPPATRPRL